MFTLYIFCQFSIFYKWILKQQFISLRALTKIILKSVCVLRGEVGYCVSMHFKSNEMHEQKLLYSI